MSAMRNVNGIDARDDQLVGGTGCPLLVTVDPYRKIQLESVKKVSKSLSTKDQSGYSIKPAFGADQIVPAWTDRRVFISIS